MTAFFERIERQHQSDGDEAEESQPVHGAESMAMAGPRLQSAHDDIVVLPAGRTGSVIYARLICA